MFSPEDTPPRAVNLDTPPHGLTFSHYRMLTEASGIDRTLIVQRGYRSVDDPGELQELGFIEPLHPSLRLWVEILGTKTRSQFLTPVIVQP